MKNKDTFIHQFAEVEPGVNIGSGTKIWHFSHVMKGAKIGKHCKIGQNVVIHSTAEIGDNVKIQNNVTVYDGVILKDNVFCGPACVFTNIVNPRSAIPRNTSEFYKNMQGVSFVALFFSALGTILGGIWADQSWGRFWGWDPKENGALLIILWLLWLLLLRSGSRRPLKRSSKISSLPKLSGREHFPGFSL